MPRSLRPAFPAESHLSALDPKSELLNAVVETPKGSRNKYKFDPELGLYELKTVLPEGDYFPYDFGFVPSTVGDDGDPLDVLILTDEPACMGALVRSRLIGVLEATQAEHGKAPERNDRLIAVADASRTHRNIHKLKDIPEQLLKEIEQFFVSYNAARGKKFQVKRRRGRKHAAALIAAGERRRRTKSKAR